MRHLRRWAFLALSRVLAVRLLLSYLLLIAIRMSPRDPGTQFVRPALPLVGWLTLLSRVSTRPSKYLMLCLRLLLGTLPSATRLVLALPGAVPLWAVSLAK